MNLIVAFNKNNVIGSNNTIPWYIPYDLKQFKKLTHGHIIVLGRKTFESLPNGPLKNRIHIIITKNKDKKNSNNIYYTNFENSFNLLKKQTNKKIFIIGGNQIYTLYFKYCKNFYITYVNNNVEGDIYFPYKLSFYKNNFIEKSKKVVNGHIYYLFTTTKFIKPAT